MKLFTCLLLGGSFNWKQPSTSGLLGDKTALKREKLGELLETAKAVGQVGSMASEEDRLKMEVAVQNLIPLSDSKKPARYPLRGVHELVYSAAPGASSGKIGPFVGKVSQFFEDDDIFYNRVEFGPLQIALRAKREVKNDDIIKVSFLETSFNLFGKTVRKSSAGGGGVWKVKFVGTYQDKDGKEKLMRIMETPSLFVLQHDLN
jgi:PAP_fibrillin